MWDAYAYKTATERSAELRAYLTTGGDYPTTTLRWIGMSETREGASALVLAAHAGGHVCDHNGGRWSAADVGTAPDWIVAHNLRIANETDRDWSFIRRGDRQRLAVIRGRVPGARRAD